MIKFNKYNVRNTETGAKARVYYSLDNHVSGKPCVCVRGKDVLEKLIPVFGEGVQNDSDSMTDYSEPDRVRMFEDHPLYVEARAAVDGFRRAIPRPSVVPAYDSKTDGDYSRWLVSNNID
jgi:hypothetical protein